MIVVYILIGFLLLYFVTLYTLYFIVFSGKNKKTIFNIKFTEKQLETKNKVYKELTNHYKKGYENIEILSDDNLKLNAKYFHNSDNNITIIHFHGFKSNNEKDCSGIKKIAFDNNYNLLIPNHRAHSTSEGKNITYGIKERMDILKWANYISTKYPNNKIILSGTSLGGASTLMASDLNLPENVIGLIADSPFSSPLEIINKIIKDKKLPIKLVSKLVITTGSLFAKINIKSHDAIKSIKKTKIPALIFHSKDDRIILYKMSEELYKKNEDKVELHLFENVDHSGIYFENDKDYTKIILNFIKRVEKNENK